jgi:UDP-GlcNAc3NAcA epimerase
MTIDTGKNVTQKHILTLIGARPQFIKAAVMSHYLRQHGDNAPIRETIVHSGQHYDASMSQIFFDELGITPAKYNLEVGSAPASLQIARILERFDPIIEEEKPDAILVYGDTNSTLAAAIATTRHDLPLIHVEAGERLFRRHGVPEESNRIATDNLAALCLTASTTATTYLLREGYANDRVHFVGDPMYDLFLRISERIKIGDLQAKTPENFGLQAGNYILATIHRAENTKSHERLKMLLQALDDAPMPILLPLHPRVKNIIQAWDWQPQKQLHLAEALGYTDLIAMLHHSVRVFTDSGGVQREAFFARKPTIVPLQDTPWQNIIEAGWLQLAHSQDDIQSALNHFEATNSYPEGMFGDGNSSRNIVQAISDKLPQGEPAWHYLGSIETLPKQSASTFSHDGYRHLLNQLREHGYNENLTILHPVLFDIANAQHLATIEADMSLSATYFIATDSDAYNPFTKQHQHRINDIMAQGHNIKLLRTRSTTDKTASKKLLDVYFGDVASEDWHDVARALQNTSEHELIFSDATGDWHPILPLAYQQGGQGKTIILIVHPYLWQSVARRPLTNLHHWTHQTLQTINTHIQEHIHQLNMEQQPSTERKN